MTLENNRAPLLHHIRICASFQTIGEVKLEVQSGNTQFGSKSAIFCHVRPWIWQMTLKNNKAPLLCSFKLCASFHSHWWIQTGVQKRSISFKIDDFLFVWPFHLTNDLENNRAPFLYYIKLCASFQSHELIQSWITVRKLSILVNIGIFFVPCDLQI